MGMAEPRFSTRIDNTYDRPCTYLDIYLEIPACALTVEASAVQPGWMLSTSCYNKIFGLFTDFNFIVISLSRKKAGHARTKNNFKPL